MTEVNLGKMTQIDRVIWFMQTNGSITPTQAKDELGIMRLAAVIFQIKILGYAVKTDIIEVCERWGNRTHVASYSLQNQLDFAV